MIVPALRAALGPPRWRAGRLSAGRASCALVSVLGGCLCIGAAAAAEEGAAAGDRDDSRRQASADRAAQQAVQVLATARSQREERLRRIEVARARGSIEVAIAACRRLAHDFPGDEEIESLHRDLLAERLRRQRGDEAARLDDVRQEMALRTEMDLIPVGIEGRPVYPADWQARTDRRRSGESASAEPAWRESLRNRLAERVSFVSDGRTGPEVLRSLAVRHDLNLVVAPALLAVAGEPLALHAPSIRLDHLITWIARSMGTTWSLSRGAVWVGPDAEVDPVLAVHDISSLLIRPGDQPERRIALVSASSGSAGASAAFEPASISQATVPAITADEVVDLIRSAVSPATWERPGCGIRVQGRQLFVNAPAEVHALVREFLRAQDRQQNVQVRIEARWLDVQDRFLEEIGVDWTALGTPFTTSTGQGVAVDNQRGGVAGSARSVLPATAMAINPALSGTGLGLGAMVLDRVQATAALAAVERTQKARILESLSVVTLNGVRANIFTGNQSAYVASYQIVNNNYDPEVKVLTGGMDLSVRPLVSADRRYVTVELRPSVSSIRFASEMILGVRSFLGEERIISGPMVYVVDLEIGLPIVDLRTGGTTAMIPDGGSLLVGGFNRSLDQIASTRVPYLGSIPFLGRLFGRRGRYSQHDRLFLLASATIIAYDELETRL